MLKQVENRFFQPCKEQGSNGSLLGSEVLLPLAEHPPEVMLKRYRGITPQDVKRGVESAGLGSVKVSFSESKSAQIYPKESKSPSETRPKGLIWRTQEESNPTAKDEENPSFSKSSAPSLWPSAAQRARKRAKFTMPEHVEFVGNWEVDDAKRTVVALN